MANMSGADLNNAELIEANMCGINLAKADLATADLSGAHLGPVELRKPDGSLSGRFWPANLSAASFKDAKLAGADLRMANLI